MTHQSDAPITEATVTAGDPKKLAALLKKLRASAGDTPLLPPDGPADAPDGFDELLHQLVFSMMLWEATSGQARNAVRRLREHFADMNELRVCMPDDTVQCLGDRYPLARERALRLRHALHDIFTRQQVLNLSTLRAMSRRDASIFLESLDGLPLFVAQRVSLLSLDAHTCPMDSRMRDHLARDRIVPEGLPAADASRFVSQHTRPEDSLQTYLLLQQWSDERSDTPRRTKASKAVEPEPHAARPSAKKAKPARPTPRKAKGSKP